MPTASDDIHSREQLAGYDKGCLEYATVVIVGCGAIGNNVAQTLALSGIHEIRCIDMDVVEKSNAPRSPLFNRACLASPRPRRKAKELAMGILAISHAKEPLVRYAVARIEALGLGAFKGANAIVMAVDDRAARHVVVRAAQLLGIPLVEAGFRGSKGQTSAFANQDPAGPCWTCLDASRLAGRSGCGLYAKAVQDAGATPATQSIAAALSAVAAEQTIQALHGRFPMDGRVLHLDVRTGRSQLHELTRDPSCRHSRLGPIEPLEVSAHDPLSRVFDVLAKTMGEPRVRLPAPVLVEAPCAVCRTVVKIGKPDWLIDAAPRCVRCPDEPVPSRYGTHAIATVAPGDEAARRLCKRLGLPPLAVFEVQDLATREVRAFELKGSIDDLFTGVRRNEAAPAASAAATVGALQTEQTDDP